MSGGQKKTCSALHEQAMYSKNPRTCGKESLLFAAWICNKADF